MEIDFFLLSRLILFFLLIIFFLQFYFIFICLCDFLKKKKNVWVFFLSLLMDLGNLVFWCSSLVNALAFCIQNLEPGKDVESVNLIDPLYFV
jgi:hypothetical protein